MEITQIMSQLLTTTLSQNEYLGYKPFLHEVAAAGQLNIAQINNGSQVMTYYQYYLHVDEQDMQVWSELDESFIGVSKV
jgi:hypothetical protein